MESIEWKKVIITCVSLDAEVLARATTYKVPFQQKLLQEGHKYSRTIYNQRSLSIYSTTVEIKV